jgi:hypothetical protein
MIRPRSTRSAVEPEVEGSGGNVAVSAAEGAVVAAGSVADGSAVAGSYVSGTGVSVGSSGVAVAVGIGVGELVAVSIGVAEAVGGMVGVGGSCVGAGDGSCTEATSPAPTIGVAVGLSGMGNRVGSDPGSLDCVQPARNMPRIRIDRHLMILSICLHALRRHKPWAGSGAAHD